MAGTRWPVTLRGYSAVCSRDDDQWTWVIFEGGSRWEKAIEHVIEQAARLANDPDVKDRVTYARNTVERFKQGLAVEGWTEPPCPRWRRSRLTAGACAGAN